MRSHLLNRLLGTSLLVVLNTPIAAQHFLGFPLSDPSVSVWHGWLYDDGSYHGAVDYPEPIGTAVLAAADGIAMASSQVYNPSSDTYGSFVLIKHPNGFSTLYAHLSAIATGITAYAAQDKYNSNFVEWTAVKKGDIVGYVGLSGVVTTERSHLHFEVASNPTGTYSGHILGRIDSYDLYSVGLYYPPSGPDFTSCGIAFSWVACPIARGLDSGPWPTQDHDNRRSNQSTFAGPISPGAPQLIYDAGSPILNELVITSDGKLVLGGYSNNVVANKVVAIDSSGKAVWQAPFSLIANNNESPIGFSVDASGRIDIAVHDWPDLPGPYPVHLYSLLPNGTSAPNWPIPFPAMYQPAAIANDGTIYQMDELANLRALKPSDGSVIWQQHLPGFSQGAIALDSSGNLYVGTDGGRYGGNGFWSFSPSGILRWSVLADNLGTPVVSTSDLIYVASQTGTVYAFTSNGTLVPGWPFSSGVSPPPDAQQDPLAITNAGTIYLKTVSGLSALNPDGTVKWTFAPGGDGSMSPSVVLDSSENAYVAFGNTVYSLTSSGMLRWSVPLASPGSLFVGGPGTLYAISANERLYAIR